MKRNEAQKYRPRRPARADSRRTDGDVRVGAAGLVLKTAERLADLITQRDHLRDEERLVAGLRAKVDRDIAECLQVIQEAAR